MTRISDRLNIHIDRLGARLRTFRTAYLRWQDTHMPESVELIIIALLLGIFTGMAAAALKGLISLLNNSILAGVHIGKPNIRFLIWPLAGILLTSIYQRYVIGHSVARGTRIVSETLKSGNYLMSPFFIFNPIVGCAVTIGTGASGGSEGPTALSGAAIGSAIGRWFGVSRDWMRILVGIGGGAGIAAIFKSPFGGVLFALEVLQLELTTLPVIALILACLLSSTTAYFLSDFTFDIFFDRAFTTDAHTFGWIALLGFFCGLYSIYYTYTKTWATGFFGRIRNPWVAAVATGVIMSVAVFMFPTLFGEGMNIITDLINGRSVSFTDSGILARQTAPVWTFVALGAIILMKGVLVAAANGGGGVSGDFVPTFFAGAVAGYLFASLCNILLGTGLPVWFFALAGMGAVMAGTIHAPLMAVFILCESTDTFCFILPYLIAVGISYATVKILTPRSWESETSHDDLLSLMSDKWTPALRTSDKKPQDQK